MKKLVLTLLLSKRIYKEMYKDVAESELKYRKHFFKYGYREKRISNLLIMHSNLGFKISSQRFLFILIQMIKERNRIEGFASKIFRQNNLWNINYLSREIKNNKVNLAISQDVPGGVNNAIRTEAMMSNWTHSIYIVVKLDMNTLNSDIKIYYLVIFENGNEKFSFPFVEYRNHNSKFIINFLKSLNIKIVSIHVLKDFDNIVLELDPDNEQSKVVIYLHDYTFVTGNWQPLKSGNTDQLKETSILNLTETLKMATIIIAPSKFIADEFLKYKGIDKRLRVAWHFDETFPELIPVSINKRTESEPIKLGVIGEIGWGKGLANLKKLDSELVYETQYSLCVIGKTNPHVNLNNTEITGMYKLEQLENLIVSKRIDIVVFLNEIPETYSFVLSECLRTGLPIIAPKIGAFVERISHRENTFLYEGMLSIENISNVAKFLLTPENKSHDFWFREKILQNREESNKFYVNIYGGGGSDYKYSGKDTE